MILEMYVPILSDIYDDYDKRLNDLASLEDIAGRYESLETLLTDLALEPPEKSVLEARRSGLTGCLTLSTIHSAKGLEWHTVFLIHLAEGSLPSYRAFEQPDAIEEERRLFYVAATRAKENLYLLRPLLNRNSRSFYDQSRSGYTHISRFLTEGRILRELVAKQGMRTETLARYHQEWDREFDVDRNQW
jgi:DNA helicase-2/ATP-dependent DNA helicase PcrA